MTTRATDRVYQRASDAVWLLAHDLFAAEGNDEPLWKMPQPVINVYKARAKQKLVEKFRD